MTRSDLLGAIVDALPPEALELGCEVQQVEEEAAGAVLRFVDGRTAQADLVVDAGGLRSIGAKPDAVSYRGYGGVVALSDPVVDESLGGLAAEYWGWGERFGLFKLTGNRHYWFFMRDQSAAARPPSHDEIAMRALRFLPAIGRAVDSTPPERLIPFSLYARAVPRAMGRDRVVRVGDAAHAMEPNLGQGACQALEDAVALGAAAHAHAAEEIVPVVEQLRLQRVCYIARRAAEGRHGAGEVAAPGGPLHHYRSHGAVDPDHASLLSGQRGISISLPGRISEAGWRVVRIGSPDLGLRSPTVVMLHEPAVTGQSQSK